MMRKKSFLSSESITSVSSRHAEKLKTAEKTSCSRVADRVILTLFPQHLQKTVFRPANLEGDASYSEQYHPDHDWNKNIKSWSNSTAKVKVTKF